MMQRWNERFLSSTRGQIVQILRRGEATVNELAEALGVTGNAVRSHLAKLERDRLVRPTGKRAGTRKPETLYGLTAEAEGFFPKAYATLFSQLLTALGNRHSPDEIEELLREVGRQVAADQPAPAESADLKRRAEVALEVIEKLGGLAKLREADEQLIIEGLSCPLAQAVEHHPEVCQLAEALLTELVGMPVAESCVRNGPPQCEFYISRTDS